MSKLYGTGTIYKPYSPDSIQEPAVQILVIPNGQQCFNTVAVI